MRKIAILVSLVLSLFAVQVHAEGLSLLAGFQTVSFGGDLSKYYDIPSGPGIVLNLGLPSVVGMPIDITVGQRSADERGSGRDVKYSWVEAGPRFLLGREGGRIRPEIVAGGGFYNLEIGDQDFDGAAGLYAGFGFEDFATEKISGRFLIKGVYWKSDTYSTDAPSLNFVLMYGIRF